MFLEVLHANKNNIVCFYLEEAPLYTMTLTIFGLQEAHCGLWTYYINTQCYYRLVSVYKSKVDEFSWTKQAMSLGTHISGLGRHLNVELLQEL